MGLSFTLALFGFAMLALAMRSHHREMLGADCSRRRSGLLRVVAAVLLAASYNCLRVVWGVIEGTIDWFCLASMAALVIVLFLSIATSLRVCPRRGGGPQHPGATAYAPGNTPGLSEDAPR
ncbi:uncharacterized protein DUF3325 [Paraburkholderia silvatlantica]|uniref:Uncharacterized protein DUF3325 n=1 Tax=Paraburkholderia silvatlantica TaxID=321895 RepID=A0A2V4TXZ9_9BURK|nr:uncharacterized protein DUF3325 [Paraburkholderia silvatlantica]